MKTINIYKYSYVFFALLAVLCFASCGDEDPVASCNDGIKNGTETGIDCGGDCIPCATCVDGIQNGNEEGVDCGGDCPACPTDERTTFDIIFGGSLDEDNSSNYGIIETSDGGYIISNDTRSFGNGQSDGYVVKFDSEGNMEWEKAYGGSGFDSAEDIVEVSDGYIIAGRFNDDNLYKIDLQGNLLWIKNITFFENNEADRIYSNGSDNFLVRSSSRFVSIDLDGTIIWQYDANTTGDFLLDDVATNTAGDFILSGTKYISNTTNELFLKKLSKEGAELWTATYAIPHFASDCYVSALMDGSYIISYAWQWSTINNDYELTSFKVDPSGSKLNSNSLGYKDMDDLRVFIYDLTDSGDGGAVLLYRKGTDVSNPRYLWIAKIDNNLNLVWKKNLGGDGYFPSSIARISDGGFLIGGYVSNNNTQASDTDLFLIKTDSEGNT